jgi:hypothetical protein
LTVGTTQIHESLLFILQYSLLYAVISSISDFPLHCF